MTYNYSYASLTTWSADDSDAWQLAITTPFLFSIESCSKFNQNLENKFIYEVRKQKYNPNVFVDFGKPETRQEFENRLPIIDLSNKQGREYSLDGNHVKLYSNSAPTSDISLKEHLSKYTENKAFYLCTLGVLRDDGYMVSVTDS